MAFSSSSDDDDVLSEINITPLVDVMLVLLVAFIVTAPLLNNALHVKLPKTESTAPAPATKTVMVSIDAHGQIYVDRETRTLEQLDAAMRALAARDPNSGVSLQADASVPYGTVAKAMAAIEHAGVTKLAVLTESAGA
ncbi:outer membrane transport energization protein ExbD [Paraburkholderia sp. GV068]|jgi:biopolymer transport protein ExbD|uniref:ExbD/TolR family protein n=1 Tax=Paraburkholderia TaxID=1822464 RepID=UPI000D328232|nr:MULTISPECIES: biopolymer transporter ExbD [Paraburkholderia]AXF08412.1 biopolymer transporter ExbD [Paraburkholderia graminis]MDQ0623579.1 biopolymer transport protein TolR [Paraburkholderia graminis]MDR6467258.1 biopolymer transport protein ExbD [Paraburkholderia graminis]MDR6473455.1 biopolymer transport protein ExbD [Paraburkholderia graminis]PTR04105.1 outer membrane transport energization protein ExbD [Paraburkholderia sp. GV072]